MAFVHNRAPRDNSELTQGDVDLEDSNTILLATNSHEESEDSIPVVPHNKFIQCSNYADRCVNCPKPHTPEAFTYDSPLQLNFTPSQPSPGPSSLGTSPPLTHTPTLSRRRSRSTPSSRSSSSGPPSSPPPRCSPPMHSAGFQNSDDFPILEGEDSRLHITWGTFTTSPTTRIATLRATTRASQPSVQVPK